MLKNTSDHREEGENRQMKNFVKNIKQKIEAEIDRIEQQRTDRLDKIKQIVSCIQAALSSLHAAITKYRFENLQEEIHFFKVWKPEISSLLIYYVRLYRIENNRTGKSPSAQCKYLKNEYDHLKKGHPDEVFYNYYQSGKTESDHLFFTREYYDILSDVHCRDSRKQPINALSGRRNRIVIR